MLFIPPQAFPFPLHSYPYHKSAVASSTADSSPLMVDSATSALEVGQTYHSTEASHPTKTRFQCDDAGNNCTGVEVQLELAGSDRYGRTLAYLWLPEPVEGWVLFNEELTAQGFALYNDYGEKHQHSDQIEQAADLAQSQGIGLWGTCPVES